MEEKEHKLHEKRESLIRTCVQIPVQIMDSIKPISLSLGVSNISSYWGRLSVIVFNIKFCLNVVREFSAEIILFEACVLGIFGFMCSRSKDTTSSG